MHALDQIEVPSDLFERDTPELQQLLADLKESLGQATERLQAMLDKAVKGQIPSTANGHSYLEVKYNLMMSYCSYLTYFMLLKAEGAEVKGHPCVDRLIQIKLLLEKLKPLDLKLHYQIQKMAS